MKKNFNLILKRSSEKAIDQIMAKLKILKQNINGSINTEGNSSKDSEQDIKLKISSKNISVISQQLEEFINYLLKNTNYLNYINYYPASLESKFVNSVQELECMLKELQSVRINIKKQKMQQKLIDKEKKTVGIILEKLKDAEIREMETIVSTFDPVMFTRWESIKSTRKLETLEGFLSDIKSKQLALEKLNTLVTRKLTNLKNVSNKNKNSLIALQFPALELPENTIPPPPPLPLPLPPPLELVPYSAPSQIPTRQRQRIEDLRRYQLFRV
ncbi:arp2/3 complex-activating protein rickA-like isoform X2 [Microplitis mediator]|uniref:arp2/3 complex-activating protein rickA-like isoform X2 n=1 Tax=Microplitis mediator TaxID=375433 RepID=UPI0025541A0E|nr:arp2/3 complex-activating protein rickA-like isoform X2 [Microplitis mediator]